MIQLGFMLVGSEGSTGDWLDFKKWMVGLEIIDSKKQP